MDRRTITWIVTLVLTPTILMVLSLSEGVFAAQTNESTGPGGYGWQQVYEVPATGTSAVRITGSADRQYYDHGYKEIQVSGRYENYWARDCGWWYVQDPSPAVYVTVYDNASNVVIGPDQSVSTEKGRGTYNYTWGDSANEAPGDWTVLVKNDTAAGYVVAQFKIFVRGQLNITAITITPPSPTTGAAITINATLRDHAGSLVPGDAMGLPQVTAYITGSGEEFEVTLEDNDNDGYWNGTSPNLQKTGDHKIIVKASDGHQYWVDGRNSTTIAVAGTFPYSFASSGGSIVNIVLMVFLALLFFRRSGPATIKKGSKI